MRTVTVLVEGYVKAIEGRQLIPGVAADGARHVAGTVTLIQDDRAVIVADPSMVTERAFIAQLDASRQKVLAIADWIIPSHGRTFRNSRKGQP